MWYVCAPVVDEQGACRLKCVCVLRVLSLSLSLPLSFTPHPRSFTFSPCGYAYRQWSRDGHGLHAIGGVTFSGETSLVFSVRVFVCFGLEGGDRCTGAYNHRASLTLLFRACDLPERLTHQACPPTHAPDRHGVLRFGGQVLAHPRAQRRG